MLRPTMLAIRVREMDPVAAKLANREIFPSLRTPTSEVDVVAAVSMYSLLLRTKGIQ